MGNFNIEKSIYNIYAVDHDELYPWYSAYNAERSIGGEAKSFGTETSWKLENIKDVLKMDWNHYCIIPEDKIEWINKVLKETKEVQDYLINLPSINKEQYEA